MNRLSRLFIHGIRISSFFMLHACKGEGHKKMVLSLPLPVEIYQFCFDIKYERWEMINYVSHNQ